MTNLEANKDEIKKLIKKGERFGCAICKAKNKYCKQCCGDDGDDILCNVVDWLLEEHKEPIKLKKWEYDLLTLIDKERTFFSISKLRKLREKGHFKGVTDTLMDMEEILEDFVIVSDDYEGFDDCK